MKRLALPSSPTLIGVGAALLIVVVWVLFIGYVNTRTMTYQVQVAGSVDEVHIYNVAKPDEPLASIATDGEDTHAVVTLAKATGTSFLTQNEPAQYYFETTQGEQTYRSSIICCETGLAQTSANL